MSTEKQIVIDLLLAPEVDIREKHALLHALAEKIYTEEGTNINNDRWLWIRDALQADYTAAPLVPVVLLFAAIEIHASLKQMVITEYNDPAYLPPILRDESFTGNALLRAKDMFLRDFFQALSAVLALFRSSDPILVSEKIYIVLEYISQCWYCGIGELPSNITTPARPKEKDKATAAVKRKLATASRKK